MLNLCWMIKWEIQYVLLLRFKCLSELLQILACHQNLNLGKWIEFFYWSVFACKSICKLERRSGRHCTRSTSCKGGIPFLGRTIKPSLTAASSTFRSPFPSTSAFPPVWIKWVDQLTMEMVGIFLSSTLATNWILKISFDFRKFYLLKYHEIPITRKFFRYKIVVVFKLSSFFLTANM